MKRTILTLVFAVAAIVVSSESVQAQAVKADSVKAVPPITAQDKEYVIGVISTAKNLLLESSTPSTLKQGLTLLQQMEQVINLLNERLVVSKPIDAAQGNSEKLKK